MKLTNLQYNTFSAAGDNIGYSDKLAVMSSTIELIYLSEIW